MSENAQAPRVSSAPGPLGAEGHATPWPKRFAKPRSLGGSAIAFTAELVVGADSACARILTVPCAHFESLYATLHTLRAHAAFLPCWEVVDLGDHTLLVFPAASADQSDARLDASGVPKRTGRFQRPTLREPRADIESRLAAGISLLCSARLSALCAALFERNALVTYRGQALIDTFVLLEASLQPETLASLRWNKPHLQGLLRFAKDPVAHANEVAGLVARILDAASPEPRDRQAPYPLTPGAAPARPESLDAAVDTVDTVDTADAPSQAVTQAGASPEAPALLTPEPQQRRESAVANVLHAAPLQSPPNGGAEATLHGHPVASLPVEPAAAPTAAVAVPGPLPHPSELPPSYEGYYRPYNAALSDDVTRTQTRSELSISPEYTPSPTPPVLPRRFGRAQVPKDLGRHDTAHVQRAFEDVELNIEVDEARHLSAEASGEGWGESVDVSEIPIIVETTPTPQYFSLRLALQPKSAVGAMLAAGVLLTTTTLLVAMLAAPSAARTAVPSAEDVPTSPDLAGQTEAAYVRHHLCGTPSKGCSLQLNAAAAAKLAGEEAAAATPGAARVMPAAAPSETSAAKPVAKTPAAKVTQAGAATGDTHAAAPATAKAPPAKAPKATAPTSVASGAGNDVRVRIECNAGASVWINGAASGKCPLTQRLPVGWHSVAVGFDAPTERTLVELKASKKLKRIRVNLPSN